MTEELSEEKEIIQNLRPKPGPPLAERIDRLPMSSIQEMPNPAPLYPAKIQNMHRR